MSAGFDTLADDRHVLVVGSTGQLGHAIVQQLVTRQIACVAMVRATSTIQWPVSPLSPLVQRVYADLRDITSLRHACADVSHVIATANAVIPTESDAQGQAEVDNYARLLKVCKEQGVRQFIYISAFTLTEPTPIPEFATKREIERMISQSGLRYTIFRAAPFMDIYYALLGSRTAMAGATAHSLERDFWLSKQFMRLVRGLIEDWGWAVVPGDGRAEHCFVCIADVAKQMVDAMDDATAAFKTIELEGPQRLSWNAVTQIHAQIFNQRVRTFRVPLWLFRCAAWGFRRWSPAAENMLIMLHHLALPSPHAKVPIRQVLPTTTIQFLQEKRKVVT